ncbi:MAG: hypothetical protein ACKOQ8_05700 [Micrococcales bacterium]
MSIAAIVGSLMIFAGLGLVGYLFWQITGRELRQRSFDRERDESR